MLAIAKECNVGTGTVQRIAREIAGAGSPFASALGVGEPPNLMIAANYQALTPEFLASQQAQ